MCDIDNPLYGTNGVASVFHRKNAQTPPACRHVTQRLKRGGLGRHGLWNALFLGAELKMGIETVLYSVSFEKTARRRLRTYRRRAIGRSNTAGQSCYGRISTIEALYLQNRRNCYTLCHGENDCFCKSKRRGRENNVVYQYRRVYCPLGEKSAFSGFRFAGKYVQRYRHFQRQAYDLRTHRGTDDA